jgi:hypothetical protein
VTKLQDWWDRQPRDRKIAWCMFIFSNTGFVVCLVLFILHIISSRFMLGITLGLSWMALQYESANSIFITKDD